MKGSGKRGHRRQRPGGRPPERRTPPPESTGKEQQLFAAAAKAGTVLCLRLRNGETVHGSVAEFDTHSLRLSTQGGHELFVPLTEIRYLEEG